MWQPSTTLYRLILILKVKSITVPTPMQTADCVLLTSIHSLKVNFIKVLYYLVNNTLFLEFRDILCIALHIMLQLRLLFLLTICDNSLRFHIYFLFCRLDLAVLFLFCLSLLNIGSSSEG